MKKLNLSFLLIGVLLFCCTTSRAQLNLPYTLAFSSDEPAQWADGIAQDGEGGTSKINGLSLLIYTASADHTTLYPGSTIVWHDNTYLGSSTGSYTGITSGPDINGNQ